MRYERSLKGLIFFSAVIWILLVVVVHQKLTVQHKRMERQASPRHHTGSPLSLQCGNQTVEIKDRECFKRLESIANNPNPHSCFQAYRVNTKDKCAVLRYLVYVEGVCRAPESSEAAFAAYTWEKNLLLRSGELPHAKCQTNLGELLTKMDECGEVCRWMKQRIESLTPDWAVAIGTIADQKGMERNEPSPEEPNPEVDHRNATQKHPYGQRRQLRILLHMGLLTRQYGLNFGEAAFAGGPLGELVQWADLAAALHGLGHDVILSWSPERLKTILPPPNSGECRKATVADLVFTDIVGLEQMKAILGSLYHYRCRLRVLDVYGTEPEFNHPRYNTANDKAGTWGGKGLDPRQFYTHFPHSPDNSFLGFVVRKGNAAEADTKNDVALLYGKRMEAVHGRGKHNFLQIVHKYFKEMHATMRQGNKKSDEDEYHSLPKYVRNHGSMVQSDFMDLLRRARVYVGLEWPVEGPAALEAIANGVTLLNPRFAPPRNVHEGKPTRRMLKSQNPYAEKHIGEPHVYTLDIRDLDEVESVLKKIKNSPRPEPKIVHEFSHIGFLERINAYVEHQDFCTEKHTVDVKTGLSWRRSPHMWPPLESLQVKESNIGESCVVTCSKQGLICEPSFFSTINNAESFEATDRTCSSRKTLPERKDDPNLDITKIKLDRASDLCHAPSYDTLTGTCALQSDSLLLSCACAAPEYVTRLCPCRAYGKEQTALCEGCT